MTSMPRWPELILEKNSATTDKIYLFKTYSTNPTPSYL